MAVSGETIGDRVKRLRLARGMSQRELSEPGVSYAYISRIEANSRRPSLKAIRMLAPKLGVTPEYLETGEPVPPSLRREWRLADAELELRLGRDLDKAEAAFRAQVREGEADSPLVARARAGLGLLAARRNDPREAIPLLEAATGSGHLPVDAHPDVYEVLGEMHVASNDPVAAILLFNRCLDDARERAPDDAALQTRFYVCLAAAHSAAGALERARSILADATKAADALPVPQARTRVYWMLGIQAWQAADSESALAYIRRAIGLLEASEDTLRLARAHMVAGRMLALDARYDEAALHLRRAERMFTLGAAPVDLGILRAEEAKVAAHRGDADKALTLADEAAELLADDARYRSNVQHAYAVAHAAAGAAAEAETSYRATLEHLTEARQWREAGQVARELSKLLRKLGRDDEAYELLDQAAALTIRHVGTARQRARDRAE